MCANGKNSSSYHPRGQSSPLTHTHTHTFLFTVTGEPRLLTSHSECVICRKTRRRKQAPAVDFKLDSSALRLIPPLPCSNHAQHLFLRNITHRQRVLFEVCLTAGDRLERSRTYKQSASVCVCMWESERDGVCGAAAHRLITWTIIITRAYKVSHDWPRLPFR